MNIYKRIIYGILFTVIVPIGFMLLVPFYLIGFVLCLILTPIVGPFIIYYSLHWSWLCFPCLYPILLIISVVGSLLISVLIGMLGSVFFLLSYAKTIWTIFTT